VNCIDHFLFLPPLFFKWSLQHAFCHSKASSFQILGLNLEEEALLMGCALKLVWRVCSKVHSCDTQIHAAETSLFSALDAWIIFTAVKHVWWCAEPDFPFQSLYSLLFMCSMCLIHINVVCMNMLHLLCLVQQQTCLDATAWSPVSPNLVYGLNQQPSFMYCTVTDN
jgi:hypothetical protein